METADCVIDARWVIPVEPGPAVLADHSVVLKDGRIEAVMPTAAVEPAYAAARRVSLPRHAVIPGLINLHTHAAMSLMRGLADDLPLMVWLKNHIWPAEAKHVSPDFVYDGTRLACAEMLAGGITCFSDMYYFPESSARAALDCGMRAAIGLIAIDLPTQYASDPDDYLVKGLAMRDAYRDQPLLSFCMAPHAPYTVSDPLFGRIRTMADELDLPVHIHLHETREEIEASLAQYRVRPLERLQALGIVGPRLIAVHGVHMSDAELDTLAKFGCSVAHCPSSNLKLASGFARVASMLERGINVGLGTDGAASNNRLDLFLEMRTAALLAKAVSGDPEAMPAYQALRAATINGARALGIDGLTGSIEPGKAADLCAVSLNGPEMAPQHSILSQLVYAAGRENVTHVWVAGRLLLGDGAFTAIDQRDLDKRIGLWQNELTGESAP
ncbi:MAG: N-ethylammeline chlorohydrolase [Betaproteobacteria bacterium RIFCSPLOWO2_02_FULL_63_19]|nr:MAG: N-ethylammeline chlorohydrolase [Betaproteobacteria bacterium RIFCSPLOWO2_02_FULL_63_19]